MQNHNLKTKLSQEQLNVLEAWDQQLHGKSDDVTGDKKNGIFNAVVIIAAHLHDAGDINATVSGIDVTETLWQLKETYDFFDWIEQLKKAQHFTQAN